MEENREALGTFLLVPSVQELAKEKRSNVPARYIQPQHHHMPVISTLHIPVIDMQTLLADSSQLTKLHLACKDWGFFQLVNHGISSSLLDKVKLETQDFFNLPMSEKRKFWQGPQEMEGFGQVFVLNEDQKLDWGDMFYMTTLPEHLRKPHLFPQLPLPFRDTLDLYTQELENLAKVIFGQMEKALKMEEKEIVKLFEDGRQATRMNYYPPCPEPDKVIGLTAHSDGVGIGISLQVNEVEGLQIMKDAMWVPVRPLPDALIISVGEILEIITNGIYQSAVHRATVNSEKERLSIATSHNPKLEMVVGSAASLITEQIPAQFKRIKVDDYYRGLFAHKLGGKSYLNTLKVDQNK